MTSAPTMNAPDCRTCGACCSGGYADDMHADCSVADVVRMSRAVRAKLVDSQRRPIGGDIRDAATPTGGEGSCVFLRGTVGRRVSCRIYNTRPKSCRDFRPGSRVCRAVRRSVGLS